MAWVLLEGGPCDGEVHESDLPDSGWMKVEWANVAQGSETTLRYAWYRQQSTQPVMMNAVPVYRFRYDPRAS